MGPGSRGRMGEKRGGGRECSHRHSARLHNVPPPLAPMDSPPSTRGGPPYSREDSPESDQMTLPPPPPVPEGLPTGVGGRWAIK